MMIPKENAEHYIWGDEVEVNACNVRFWYRADKLADLKVRYEL